MNWGAETGGQSEFLQESEFGPPLAMEGEMPGEEALLQKLRDSRRRFQRHMQQLLEKVKPPPPALLGGARARRGRCWRLGEERSGGQWGWGGDRVGRSGKEKVELGAGGGGGGERKERGSGI